MFRASPLEIPDVRLIETDRFADARGDFAEVYRSSVLRTLGIDLPIRQINWSHSTQGVLRGLHYQLRPAAQAKCIGVTTGRIFDVAVDIRKGSPTFGRWTGRLLDAAERCMLYIPEGFAHGFCVVSPFADVLYYCSAEYAPLQERGIIWNDPELAIRWPVAQPVLSPRDAQLPPFAKLDANFTHA